MTSLMSTTVYSSTRYFLSTTVLQGAFVFVKLFSWFTSCFGLKCRQSMCSVSAPNTFRVLAPSGFPPRRPPSEALFRLRPRSPLTYRSISTSSPGSCAQYLSWLVFPPRFAHLLLPPRSRPLTTTTMVSATATPRLPRVIEMLFPAAVPLTQAAQKRS